MREHKMIARIERVSNDKVTFKEFDTLEDLLKYHVERKKQLIIDNWIIKDHKDQPDANFRITILDDWLD